MYLIKIVIFKIQDVSDTSDLVNLESDLSQPSPEEVPDFLNASYRTLHKMAGLSNQDSLIFQS